MESAKEVNPMRKVLLALALLGLAAGSASATPENLSNGVYIAHYAPSLVYTTDTPAGGWGEALQSSVDAINGCEDQLNRIDGPGDHFMWFIISAWDVEEKVWCSSQVGIVGYDAGIWQFQDNGPVYPGGGAGLEIYTNNFPHGDPPGGPSGVICGPSGGNWGPANFEPIWWFEGYAYGPGYGSTVVQLGVDPATDFGGWYNCESPPGEFAATCFGAMGVNADGVYCCPEPQEPEFACCYPNGDCEVLTEEECLASNGEVYYDYLTCTPNPCPQPPEFACCFENGECVLTTVETCEVAGGEVYYDYLTCEPNPCPQPTVCCVEENCFIVLTEEECFNMGGDWHPEWDTCEPNPCIIATDDDSWGSIKAMYR
jgi:hypothetical protein